MIFPMRSRYILQWKTHFLSLFYLHNYRLKSFMQSQTFGKDYKKNIFVSDDSFARSKSMPLASPQSSQSSGKRLTRSSTESERNGMNGDDASIQNVGEPRMSNRRKVSLSSTSVSVL